MRSGWIGDAGACWVAEGSDRLLDSASTQTSVLLSTGTATAGGTTAGVASQYGEVTLVGFVVAALGVLYLWWRLRRK